MKQKVEYFWLTRDFDTCGYELWELKYEPEIVGYNRVWDTSKCAMFHMGINAWHRAFSIRLRQGEKCKVKRTLLQNGFKIERVK